MFTASEAKKRPTIKRLSRFRGSLARPAERETIEMVRGVTYTMPLRAHMYDVSGPAELVGQVGQLPYQFFV